MNSAPCQLILKIGCNESDEIFTAVNSLLRACAIDDQQFVVLERQIQPTTYFNSFTTYSSVSKLPIQCQALSCVIFLADPIFKQHEKKKEYFFKSREIWNFHHKIELIDEYKQILARQDYYELSSFLPSWSIADVCNPKQTIIRFNIFTNHFESMCEFYQNLFQRKADSSKTGFVLFNLRSWNQSNAFLYQFSIKSSPSIQSYSISQTAHFKFRLTDLNHIIRQYTRKVFLINPSEYYIYDPDGNLLHLCLHSIKETPSSQTFVQPTDSGFGDSSDPSAQLFHSRTVENPSRSSNDSGRWSSRSSIRLKKEIAVRSAKKSEIESRLFNTTSFNNRFYSSMNNVQKLNQMRSKPITHTTDYDLSYNVDSPSIGYLDAYLLKKQMIDQFEKSQRSRPRSKSVTFDQHPDPIREPSNSRINIGITLDSRLRRTPVLDMLRSTTMQLDPVETHPLNAFIPIARF